MLRRARPSDRPPAKLDQMISWYASPNVIPGMLANAARQDAKDRLFLQRMRRFLRPGTVLELGAGVGQLSMLMASMGFDVTASDIHPHLVAFMRSRGLKAEVVDARWIERTLHGPFDNVLTCGLHTLLTKDLEGAEKFEPPQWRVLGNARAASDGTVSFIDFDSDANGQRFYRARQ